MHASAPTAETWASLKMCLILWFDQIHLKSRPPADSQPQPPAAEFSSSLLNITCSLQLSSCKVQVCLSIGYLVRSMLQATVVVILKNRRWGSLKTPQNDRESSLCWSLLASGISLPIFKLPSKQSSLVIAPALQLPSAKIQLPLNPASSSPVVQQSNIYHSCLWTPSLPCHLSPLLTVFSPSSVPEMGFSFLIIFHCSPHVWFFFCTSMRKPSFSNQHTHRK